MCSRLHLLLKTIHSVSEIREAADGLETIALAQEMQPDVVLADARMPKMDGVEAARIIKTSWPHIQVIVLYSKIEVGWWRDSLVIRKSCKKI